MSQAHYLLTLLCQCSEHAFGQDAIEWAITSGRIKLSYNLNTDTRHITNQYDYLIEQYRQHQRHQRLKRAA